jgi:hypothetical protein
MAQGEGYRISNLRAPIKWRSPKREFTHGGHDKRATRTHQPRRSLRLVHIANFVGHGRPLAHASSRHRATTRALEASFARRTNDPSSWFATFEF